MFGLFAVVTKVRGSGGTRDRFDPERKPWISKNGKAICHNPTPDKHFICREEC
jgi:hypothetical protein